MKQSLTKDQNFELRQIAQIATLDAIMAARDWQAGELTFHGGTSLHLAYQSPRFSEDIDFMVDKNMDLTDIAKIVQHSVTQNAVFPMDMEISIEKQKDDGRMLSFFVVASSDEIEGKIRVKVEMWRTPKETLEDVRVNITTTNENTPLYVSQLLEIMADKLFAQGGREYLKARDIFDIWWMMKNNIQPRDGTPGLEYRFKIYNVGGMGGWRGRAQAKYDVLNQELTKQKIEDDLRKWLPSDFPLETHINEIIEYGKTAIADAIEHMQSLSQQNIVYNTTPGMTP